MLFSKIVLNIKNLVNIKYEFNMEQYLARYYNV